MMERNNREIQTCISVVWVACVCTWATSAYTSGSTSCMTLAYVTAVCGRVRACPC